MKHFRTIKKVMAALLMLAMLIPTLPAALAESFSAFVQSSSMAVYAEKSLSTKIGKLDQYTVVTVTSYSGKVARIQLDGHTGYARISDMARVDAVAEPAVVNTSTKVYQKPATSSPSARLAKNTRVNLIAVNGKWALIERDGIGGYTYAKYLTSTSGTPAVTATPTIAPTKAPDLSQAIPAVVSASKVTVYQSANTSSKSLGTIQKGAKVNVIEIKGSWAYVERNGSYGYCSVTALTPESQATPTPTPEPTVAPTKAPDLSKVIPAVVSASKVTVYQSANTSSKSLGTIKKGAKVNVIEIKGSWAYVERNGSYGYCSAMALTPENQATPTPTPEPTVAPTKAPDLSQAIPAVVSASKVTVYQSANTSSKSLGTIKKGTKVNVIEIKGSWAYVERNGSYGYCSAMALTPENQATPTPTVAPTQTPDLSQAIPAVVSASKVTVYQSANTSSKSLGTIKKGTKVNVIEIKGSWAYVERNGSYGYCSAMALTPENQATPTPTPEPTVAPTKAPDLSQAIPAVVSASKVTVYQSANTSSKSLGTIKKGTKVNVIEIKGSWAYVERNGSYGYCSAMALTPENQTTATPAPTQTPDLSQAIPAVVSAAKVKVYADASTSSAYLGTIKKGTKVNVIEIKGSWAYIERSGSYGYCAATALKPEEIKTPDPLEGYTIENFTATVVTTNAKLYASASTGAAAKDLPLGTDVAVGAYNKDWAYAEVNGIRGFIPVSALNRGQFAELSKGSSGSTVSTLEKALLAMGYFDAVPDSSFDAATETAVKLFQTACGAEANGKASQGLQRVLYSGNAPVCSLLSGSYSDGASGGNVTRVQKRLFALGYLSKTSSVDGDYGYTTTAAVKLFQATNGLSQSGTADSGTLRKLYSTSAASLPSGKTPADQGAVIVKPDGSKQANNSTKISDGLASKTSKYTSGMSNAEKLEYAIYVGQNQLGKPYIYAANGPSSFDCTGFTCYCMKQIGVSLKRTAVNQGYDDSYAKITGVSNLRRGDLVYFNTVSDNDLSDHAGIYLGAGWFIHASSGQGKVVISTLASGYYNGVFSWGRRPF